MKKQRKEERTEQQKRKKKHHRKNWQTDLVQSTICGEHSYSPSLIFTWCKKYQHFGNLNCSLLTTKQTKDQVPWKHAGQMHFCTCEHLCTSAQCPGNPTAQKFWRPAGLTIRIAIFLWWHSILKVPLFLFPTSVGVEHSKQTYKTTRPKYFEDWCDKDRHNHEHFFCGYTIWWMELCPLPKGKDKGG